VTEPSPGEATQLLIDWSGGDVTALEKLTPVIYDELRGLARRLMRHERGGHTLQATALVNEAYARLVDQRNVRWQNRAHFFAIAARLMRRILIDYARQRHYAKRGGDAPRVSLDEAAVLSEERAAELVALDEALDSLAVPGGWLPRTDVTSGERALCPAYAPFQCSRPRDHQVDHEEEITLQLEDDPLADAPHARHLAPARARQRRIHRAQSEGMEQLDALQARPHDAGNQRVEVGFDVRELGHRRDDIT
jgi:RNA polymerase sigma factor (TIGR02999 family)